MDTTIIKCPSCGAPVRRKKGVHFAKCEYCGTEIGFDEIKEEAQVDVLQNKVASLEEKDSEMTAQRRKLRSWLRKRSILYSAVSVLIFLAFFFVGLSMSDTPSDDPLVGAGAICLLTGVVAAVTGSFVLSSRYPEYNIISEKKESRFGKWLQLVLTCLGLSVLAAFLAFLVLNLFFTR